MEPATIISIILMPILCGIIGYFTNWLAIKMLFRPYTKWYITYPALNIKWEIPFTPGLFPKEQARLASKVAKTVTHQLLTPEDIKIITINLVTPDNINVAVDKIVDSILNEFQNIRKLHDISEEIALLISAFIRQSVPEIIEDGITKKTFIKDILGKAFDNLIMHLRIPEDTALTVTKSFMEHIATPNTIRNWILEVLTLENITKINKLVQDHTRGGYYIIARLITVKSILENVRTYLEEDPETANQTIEDIIMKVRLKEKLAVSISNINFLNLPYNTVALLRELFVELLSQYMLANSKMMAEKFSTEEMTTILTEKIVRFDTTRLKPETLRSVKLEIASFIGRYLEKELGNLIEQAIPALGIDNVITEKVAKFSPRRLEELITDISKRELRGIQIIGGIIGLLIGCISVIINIFIM